MDFFHNAKSVRLLSHHEKFLVAEEDEENVCQDWTGTVKNVVWTVELVEGGELLRLKSCYGKYLTASSTPYLLGMKGKRVLQTAPTILDSSVEWKPIREGFQVKLQTHCGQYLRANGGLPPWRNSITHDIPHRPSTQEWILWDVDVIETRTDDDKEASATTPPATSEHTNKVPCTPSSSISPTVSPQTSPKVSRTEA